MEVLFCVSTVPTTTISSMVCVQPRRESWRVSPHCFPMWIGDRVEADDAAVQGLVELKVFLLRTLHVHSGDRVVVRRQMLLYFVSKFLSVGVKNVQ